MSRETWGRSLLASQQIPGKSRVPVIIYRHNLQGNETLQRKESRIKTEPRQQKMTQKTYNTGDSLVVTDPTTSPALSGLTRGERTGSRAFQMVWSYVVEDASIASYISKFSNGGGLY